LLVFITGIVAWRTRADPAPVTVQLVALRGGSNDGLPHALAGRALNLVVNRSNLPAASGYGFEFVDESGEKLWSGPAGITATRLSAYVSRRPAPGLYWIRLYAMRSGPPQDELLREFGLHLD
jgi:hypothetical protein